MWGMRKASPGGREKARPRIAKTTPKGPGRPAQERDGKKSRTISCTSATTTEKRATRPRSATRQGQREGKKGVYGVDEGEEEEEDALEDVAQDLSDMDLCAFDEVWGVTIGQNSADTFEDLPPGLSESDKFELRDKYLDPSSGT